MTPLVRRWAQFRAAEQWTLVAAAALQIACTALLRVVSFRWLAGAHGAALVRDSAPDLIALERWLWALDAAGRHLGFASSCLGRALAARTIARRFGVDLPIAIGVARADGGPLDAHAWIDGPEGLRLGAAAANRYVRLIPCDNIRTT